MKTNPDNEVSGMSELPVLREERAEYKHFPTLFQNFIFRNWESVPTKKIAKVLVTDVETVNELAGDMGLRVPAKYNKRYSERGYLTIIRNNWHLLPYSQLSELVDLTQDELAFTLREEDFFGIKLGQFKPDVKPLKYRPLTDEEKEKTKNIKEKLLSNLPSFGKETSAEDFDFLDDFGKEEKLSYNGEKRAVVLDEKWGIDDKTSGKYSEYFKSFVKQNANFSLDGNEKHITLEVIKDESKKTESHSISITKNGIKITAVDEVGVLRGLQYLKTLVKKNNSFSFDEMEMVRDTRFDIRFIHSYCALFGDPFADGGESSYPDSLFKEYSEIGINGVWIHSVLYKMYQFPWDKSISEGWQKRLEGLKNLCDRAEKYGVKIYLYINEPRTRPKAFFDKHPELLGYMDESGEGTLCTSKKPVQDYLYNGIKTICEAAPNIGGFLTITASENKTNCLSHSIKNFTYCPICKNRPQEEVYAEVNGIIKKAAESVNKDIEVIAYDWSWTWCNDRWDTVKRTAKTGSRIVCVSEEGVSKKFGDTETSVIDYSISLVGPGETAKKTWKTCKEVGGKTLAKVQFNNSWECSTIPYIPTLDLVKEHMDGICENPVDGLMLSWSLGGYPSMNLRAMSKYYFGQENDGDVYEEIFGQNAEAVRRATAAFSKAFRNLPFHVHTAYRGPFQMGPANLLFEKQTGLKATMTGYPYDDIEAWRAIFPLDVYENSLRTLSEIWKAGLDRLLSDAVIDSENISEFVEIATAGYCIYRSSYLQTKYSRLRNEYLDGKKENKAEILTVLDEEEKLAAMMYDVASKNSTIGFESANHYFFNKYSLAEKIVNIEYLKEHFG